MYLSCAPVKTLDSKDTRRAAKSPPNTLVLTNVFVSIYVTNRLHEQFFYVCDNTPAFQQHARFAANIFVT